MKIHEFTSKALEYLQQLTEQKLTLDVLIPLFKVIGFEKVDYHGGPYEGGKDLILWRTDEIDLIELAVAQIKKWKPTAKAADNKSFMEVVNQLQVASEEPVEHLDGHKYIPSVVYFITPFEINTRSLSTRFKKYSELRSRRIKIIDGVKLASLIQKNLPDLAYNILGVKRGLQSVIKQKLNNLTLLRALDYKSPKNISRFYSDLDITLGDMTSNFFLDSSFNIKSQTMKLGEMDWYNFKTTCKLAKEKYELNITKKSIIDIDKQYDKLKMETSRLSNINQKNTLEIEIEIDSILNFFNMKKKWLKEQTNRLNNPKITIESCRDIFVLSHDLFKFLNSLIKDKYVSRILNIDKIELKKAIEMPNIRISTSMDKLIATGLNLAILGDAGAGKTTCLQIQARNAILSRPDKDFIVLFLPLTQIINPYTQEDYSTGGNRNIDTLKNAITQFFLSEGATISLVDFDTLLKKNKSLILFDGIDEVISIAPWILNAINMFGETYKQSQVIISSRTGGNYLSQIDYLGFNLLPFTNKQRENFIKNWFDSHSNPRINLILKHLEKNKTLGEVIRKPLLATIMCVLAEHDVPLPKNEIRLYQERMSLLTGHYDVSTLFRTVF